MVRDFDTISVVIPTCGRTVETLSRAVKSVKAQQYASQEIIVVDDNKNNFLLSQELQKFCALNQLKYISSGGCGGGGARNCGITNATCKYVAFLDDDDEWLPNKLKVQLGLFTSSSIGLVYSRGYTVKVNADGTKTQTAYVTDKYYKTAVSYRDLLTRNYIGTTTQLLVKRDILLHLNGFDATLPSRQDYDLCLRVAKEYDCVGADQYLFRHYIHNCGQITSSAHSNMKGYQLLLSKYKDDIRKVPDSHRKFCYRIARCARKAHIYSTFIEFLLLALADNPLYACETLYKCFGLI